MKPIEQTILEAERILLGKPAPDGQCDPRWQAIIEVGRYIQSNPIEVWQFTRRWVTHPSADLRAAISTCLLEHLLQYHFNSIFPLVETSSLQSRRFAQAFTSCWKFGQSEKPSNSKRWDTLKHKIEKRRANHRFHPARNPRRVSRE